MLLKGLGFFGLGNSEETLKSHWHALLANWGGTLKEFQRLEWDFQVLWDSLLEVFGLRMAIHNLVHSDMYS